MDDTREPPCAVPARDAGSPPGRSHTHGVDTGLGRGRGLHQRCHVACRKQTVGAHDTQGRVNRQVPVAGDRQASRRQPDRRGGARSAATLAACEMIDTVTPVPAKRVRILRASSTPAMPAPTTTT